MRPIVGILALICLIIALLALPQHSQAAQSLNGLSNQLDQACAQSGACAAPTCIQNCGAPVGNIPAGNAAAIGAAGALGAAIGDLLSQPSGPPQPAVAPPAPDAGAAGVRFETLGHDPAEAQHLAEEKPLHEAQLCRLQTIVLKDAPDNQTKMRDDVANLEKEKRVWSRLYNFAPLPGCVVAPNSDANVVDFRRSLLTPPIPAQQNAPPYSATPSLAVGSEPPSPLPAECEVSQNLTCDIQQMRGDVANVIWNARVWLNDPMHRDWAVGAVIATVPLAAGGAIAAAGTPIGAAEAPIAAAGSATDSVAGESTTSALSVEELLKRLDDRDPDKDWEDAEYLRKLFFREGR